MNSITQSRLGISCDIPFAQEDDLVHAFIGGSQLHRAKMDGTDDHDIYGVFVEMPEKVIGIDVQEHFVWSTAGAERRNGPDDVDVCFYGLRKFAGLSCKGNPSVLHFLFAPNLLPANPTWQRFLENRRLFLAVTHYEKYIGYAEAQLARMIGERSRKVNRPELVLQYGFDTKFAMHVIRILVECEELLKTGWITLPSPEKELLISIRKGEVTQDWVMREATSKIEHIKDLATSCKVIPAEIDRTAVSKFVAKSYLLHWKAKALVP